MQSFDLQQFTENVRTFLKQDNRVSLDALSAYDRAISRALVGVLTNGHAQEETPRKKRAPRKVVRQALGATPLIEQEEAPSGQ